MASVSDEPIIEDVSGVRPPKQAREPARSYAIVLQYPLASLPPCAAVIRPHTSPGFFAPALASQHVRYGRPTRAAQGSQGDGVHLLAVPEQVQDHPGGSTHLNEERCRGPDCVGNSRGPASLPHSHASGLIKLQQHPMLRCIDGMAGGWR